MLDLMHLQIYDVNQQGVSYLNSIANELPVNTGVEFDAGFDEKTIELLPSMKQIYDSPFASW